MKLPRYSAQTPPPRSSGLVTASGSDISALVRSSDIARWQSVGTFGQALGFAGELTLRAYQNRQAIDDTIEWGTATSRVKDRFRLAADAAERMDVSMDMPDPDDPNYLKTLTSFSTIKRDQLLKEALKDIEKDVGRLSQGFSNPKIKAQFENWYNDNYGNLADGVRSMYTKKLDSYQRAKMSKLSQNAAENGDIETADHFVELMDKYELITPEQAEALKKNNKVIADKSITYRSAQAIMAIKGYQEAIKFVMARDIDIEIKKDIVSDLNFEAAQQREQLETAKEADRDEISKLIRSGHSATTRIENSKLDENEQWTWFERERVESERLATGKAIVTNEEIKGQLESMAYDIPTGAVALSEIKKRLWNERYTELTIDNAAYDEIFSLAQREFKSYQAGAMKEREVHALGQLVTHPSELGYAEMLAQLTSKLEKEQAQVLRQLQFDNLDKYKKALRDWLKTKPDADADEIYEAGRSLLRHFRKSPDQLRKETETKIRPPTKEQIEKISKGIQDTITGITNLKPKEKVDLTGIPEPKDRREFINKLRELEKDNPDLSRAYYNKYLDKFW